MNYLFNLQLFGEGGGDGAGASSGAAAGSVSGSAEMPVNEVGTQKKGSLSNVKYGIQDDEGTAPSKADVSTTTKQKEDRTTAFENLIKGEYKSEFDARVQGIINKRFSESKAQEAQIKDMQPILKMLSDKYGADASDIKALAKAIENDDSYYEDEAISKGLSVKQLKEMKQLERDNAELRAAQEEAMNRQKSEKIFSDWMHQTEEFNSKYGMNIDFGAEAENPDFAAILKNGGSVEAAYNAVHFHEMMGGAMYKTAQTVKEQMANNLQAKASRPAENGISSRATAITKTDVNSLTLADRLEIEKRVARGEKIRF